MNWLYSTTVSHLTLDQSVLENNSLVKGLQIINKTNLLENLSRQQFGVTRNQMIQMILSTDMTKHFQDLNQFRSRNTQKDFDPEKKDKQICMDMVIHLSDLTPPIRHWSQSRQWSTLLLQEFWHQVKKINLGRLRKSQWERN
jgi:hypothetical protein